MILHEEALAYSVSHGQRCVCAEHINDLNVTLYRLIAVYRTTGVQMMSISVRTRSRTMLQLHVLRTLSSKQSKLDLHSKLRRSTVCEWINLRVLTTMILTAKRARILAPAPSPKHITPFSLYTPQRTPFLHNFKII